MYSLGGRPRGQKLWQSKWGCDKRDNAEVDLTQDGYQMESMWVRERSCRKYFTVQNINKNFMWYLWSWRQEWFYVDVGVMHLQVMVPKSPGHSNSCHYPGLGVQAEGHQKHAHTVKTSRHTTAAIGRVMKELSSSSCPLSMSPAVNLGGQLLERPHEKSILYLGFLVILNLLGCYFFSAFFI